jgi:hypothetical protein
MNRSIDAQLEEKLGIKVPKTNEITEFCDKHGRQALEDTLWELEKEHNFLSKGVQVRWAPSPPQPTGPSLSHLLLFSNRHPATHVTKVHDYGLMVTTVDVFYL